ncbi:hypothetical protein Mapa_001088 [Marchantia paleacea]|nr:hypothetical protein Mapa_001088 [Marchantia paleacea]
MAGAAPGDGAGAGGVAAGSTSCATTKVVCEASIMARAKRNTSLNDIDGDAIEVRPLLLPEVFPEAP